MNALHEHIEQALAHHAHLLRDISRRGLIKEAIGHKETIALATGALARWTPLESTGRSPHDTYIVRHQETEHTIDWTSPNNNPLAPKAFGRLLMEALRTIVASQRIYSITRALGSKSSYALPIQIISTHAFSALFFDTMFRAVPEDMDKSIFAQQQWKLLVLPYTRVKGAASYGEALKRKDGKFSDAVIAMDMVQRTCLVMGSQYCGTIKKTMFTVMNYILPEAGILPLHSSANIDNTGNTSLMLGLSGTGKTTLSNVPSRLFIGDDEHGWSDEGIANFENGCYAKLIHLNKEKEPEIYHALFDERAIFENGCIIENAMVYPDGNFDLDDVRYTENSRGSFPISFLPRRKEDACGGHPSTILFLTADAHGVLPPIAKLSRAQALFWFLMGYTCKLAGTETGITTPVSTFSRFFGQPFMPRNPMDYISLFEYYLEKYGPLVYLVNTGWTGGPYGVGKRMDIRFTRTLVDAALSGELEKSEYRKDPLFHILVPLQAPGIDSRLLAPRSTWLETERYDASSKKLAQEFHVHFEKFFGNSVHVPSIRAACPIGTS